MCRARSIPWTLRLSCGTDIAAVARSFAAELIERGADERDRFWNDWAETMIAGGCAWLMADYPSKNRRLSALFDLFGGDDVIFSMAKLLDEKKVGEPFGKSGVRRHSCSSPIVRRARACWARRKPT